MKNSIVFNGTGFNIQTNAKRSQQEFIDRWMPIVWMDLKPGDKQTALIAAYAQVRAAAGLDDTPKAPRQKPSAATKPADDANAPIETTETEKGGE